MRAMIHKRNSIGVQKNHAIITRLFNFSPSRVVVRVDRGADDGLPDVGVRERARGRRQPRGLARHPQPGVLHGAQRRPGLQDDGVALRGRELVPLSEVLAGDEDKGTALRS